MTLPAHISDDRLMDLVQGYLDEEESEAAHQHLETCTECEQRFRIFARDREILRMRRLPVRTESGLAFDANASTESDPTSPGRAVKRGPMPSDVPAGERREPTSPLPGGRPASHRRAVFTTIAASVVVVLAVALLLRPAPDSVYWIANDFAPSLSRSSDGKPLGVTLQEVEKAYRARDARATLAALDGLDLSRSTPATRARAAVYRASALLNLGRPAEALGALDVNAIAFYQPAIRVEAMWIVYLASKRLDDGEGMCNALRFLSEEVGEKADRARVELSRLSCG